MDVGRHRSPESALSEDAELLKEALGILAREDDPAQLRARIVEIACALTGATAGVLTDAAAGTLADATTEALTDAAAGTLADATTEALTDAAAGMLTDAASGPSTDRRAQEAGPDTLALPIESRGAVLATLRLTGLPPADGPDPTGWALLPAVLDMAGALLGAAVGAVGRAPTSGVADALADLTAAVTELASLLRPAEVLSLTHPGLPVVPEPRLDADDLPDTRPSG